MKISLTVLFLLFCSCSTKKQVASIKSDEVSLGSVGNVQTPAEGSVTKSESELLVPANSEVHSSPNGELKVILSESTKLTSKGSSSSVKTATTPPPPSANDEANAKADFWTMLGLRLGVVVGVACFGFGLVRAWDFVMWGGGAVAVACLFGIFVQKHPALLAVIGVGVGISVAGVLLWHFKLKKTTI